MKTILTTAALAFINFNFSFLPTGTLMVAMSFAIALDFVTGVIKASFKNDARTSTGYRKTIIKFMQYGGAVCVSMLMKFLLSLKGVETMKEIEPYADFLNDGLLIFIIFIEVTSILENIYAVDKKSPFALYFIRPLLRVMTFAIKSKSSAMTPH